MDEGGEDVLLKDGREQVMMAWERPYMDACVDALVCSFLPHRPAAALRYSIARTIQPPCDSTFESISQGSSSAEVRTARRHRRAPCWRCVGFGLGCSATRIAKPFSGPPVCFVWRITKYTGRGK